MTRWGKSQIYAPEVQRNKLAQWFLSLRERGIIYVALPNAVQKRLPFGRRFLKSHEEWAKTEEIGDS